MRQPPRLSPPRIVGPLILAGLVTCDSLDNFTITETATSTVMGSLVGQLIGDLGFGSFLNMDISQNQELANQGVERHQLDSVKIQTLMLRITDTSMNQNFDFINSLEFFVEAPGLPRQRIASGSNFQAGATSIGLNVDDVELVDYATAASMDITTEASGSPPANDTTIEATISLDVDVNVGGAICG